MRSKQTSLGAARTLYTTLAVPLDLIPKGPLPLEIPQTLPDKPLLRSAALQTRASVSLAVPHVPLSKHALDLNVISS